MSSSCHLVWCLQVNCVFWNPDAKDRSNSENGTEWNGIKEERFLNSEVGVSAFREVAGSLSDPECRCGTSLKSGYQITSCSTGFWRIRTGSFILLIRTVSYGKQIGPCTWWPMVQTQGQHASFSVFWPWEGRGVVLYCLLGFWGLCQLLKVRREAGKKNGSTICEHRWDREKKEEKESQTNQEQDRGWKANGERKDKKTGFGKNRVWIRF